MTDIPLYPRRSVAEVEEGAILAPKFGEDSLMPCITTEAATGEVLMLGWMNRQALTLTTGEAHDVSRTRPAVWHTGATSGLTQRVIAARIDDNQDYPQMICDDRDLHPCGMGLVKSTGAVPGVLAACVPKLSAKLGPNRPGQVTPL